MKTLTKLAVASILALSAIAPALAAEEDILLERNTYATQNVQHNRVQPHSNRMQNHRGVDAFAFAPAGAAPTYDFGIESQH
jgi:hypothetical protein